MEPVEALNNNRSKKTIYNRTYNANEKKLLNAELQSNKKGKINRRWLQKIDCSSEYCQSSRKNLINSQSLQRDFSDIPNNPFNICDFKTRFDDLPQMPALLPSTTQQEKNIQEPSLRLKKQQYPWDSVIIRTLSSRHRARARQHGRFLQIGRPEFTIRKKSGSSHVTYQPQDKTDK